MSIKHALRKALGRKETTYVESFVPKVSESKEVPIDVLNRYYEDIKLTSQAAPDQTSLVETLKNQPRVATPHKTYQSENIARRESAGRPDRGLSFESAHYDLRELAKARDTESLINTSAEKHVETALQNGFSWKGSDEDMVNYIRTRIFEIEIVSQLTMRKVLETLLDQLATYGTAFLVVRRDKDRSTGKKVQLFGKKLDPIAAWGTPDAPSMKVSENTLGNVIGWKQEIYENSNSSSTSKVKYFDPDEVFALTRHKQAGRVFGRSMYTSTLDDALLLRSMEDLVHVITQKYAFPVFQYIVGTKDSPATDIVLPNGNVISEVELAQSVVENMPVEGGFVTPFRHEIKLIGTEGKVLDMSKYIEHFRTRVQESTRMSNAVLGTSGDQSKSSSQTQMDNLNSSSQYLQGIIKDGLYFFVFNLLAEGGFDITHENMVTLDFSASNPEETRADQNHVLAQYQADLVTHEEARSKMGKPPLSEEEKNDTFSSQNHKRDMELAKQSAAIKAANSAKKKSASSKKSGTSRTRPRNQHGTKATKTKVKKNDFLMEIKGAWSDAKVASLNHISTNEPSGGYNRVTSAMVDDMSEISRDFLSDAIREAVDDVREDMNDPLIFVSLNQRKLIFQKIRQAFKEKMTDCVGSGFLNKDKVWISAAFQTHQSAVLALAETLIDFTYNASYLAALSNIGIEKAVVADSDGKYSVTISTSDYCNRLLLSSDDLSIDTINEDTDE